MHKIIIVNGLKYDLLVQYRNIPKVEQYAHKFLKENFSICVLKNNDMWLLYGRKEAI